MPVGAVGALSSSQASVLSVAAKASHKGDRDPEVAGSGSIRGESSLTFGAGERSIQIRSTLRVGARPVNLGIGSEPAERERV